MSEKILEIIEGDPRYKLVVVAKEDVDRNRSLEGDSCTYCGLCALNAVQRELIDPRVAKVVIHTIERMTEKEAEGKDIFGYYENRCMEWGCDKPADYIVTTWL